MNYVLLVEDDLIISLELHAYLKDAGFEVEAAYSGSQAMAAIKRRPPANLVTDLNLGAGPDGLDVARYARSLRPEVQVVFMSSEMGRYRRVGEVPASTFVPKPLQGRQIVEALRPKPTLAAA